MMAGQESIKSIERLADVLQGNHLSTDVALQLSDDDCSVMPEQLLSLAAQLRDQQFHNVITYSKKVFFPLTHLCRDVCHYCTFAQTPKFIDKAYLSIEDVLSEIEKIKALGCNEALFTLGEKPELRYQAARDSLQKMGFATTLEYVAFVAGQVFEKTGLLPHINAGCMTASELLMLKPVSASMGLMLESASLRLCEKGMPHYGSPDKDPRKRLETIRLAGKLNIPFTTGILIGIGETRHERVESLLAIRQLHFEYGHIQEVIIQNFRAKPNTKMAHFPEPDVSELLWTIAVARLIFGAAMSIQVPPNLNPGMLPRLIAAGINDWGGVSPLTPDFVNPEAPWPHLDDLSEQSLVEGKVLHQRLTIYPQFIVQRNKYLDKALHRRVLDLIDTDGLVRDSDWLSGKDDYVPESFTRLMSVNAPISQDVDVILTKVLQRKTVTANDIERLFQSRGGDVRAICEAANDLRCQQAGETVSFTINRNINYTNICYFKCQFCAFSKGKLSENLRGKPYDLSETEIKRRVIEAWQRGATEVCMQGGIHPAYTGQTYLDICRWVKEAQPQMHVHAFSPLEIWHGAASLNISLKDFLTQLKSAGLNSLPGTASEVLDDEVREQLCADKINSEQWCEVMRVAHQQGIRTTATIMFGHIDSYASWAKHLLTVRELQLDTQGFTEFVPLPFVASESPIYLKGRSRKGPTFRETLLMHAIARLVLGDVIPNIQASWVKLGKQGALVALRSGANDLGGSLMNESITRAAGAVHGQELPLAEFEQWISSMERVPRVRNTFYHDADASQVAKAKVTFELAEIELTQPKSIIPSDKQELLKPGNSLDPRKSLVS